MKFLERYEDSACIHTKFNSYPQPLSSGKRKLEHIFVLYFCCVVIKSLKVYL